VSSIKPDRGSREIDSGEEVSCGLVIAGGKGSKLLQLTEKVFDEMAGLVKLAIVLALVLAIRLGWNHCGFARLRQRLENPLFRIIAFISNHNRRVESGQ
jgi:hypothetical protein